MAASNFSIPSNSSQKLGNPVISHDEMTTVEVWLPKPVRTSLRNSDVDIVLCISAHGCDRVLEPTVSFDFGASDVDGALLRWPIDGQTAVSTGVQLRLPRGLKALYLQPHRGPFVARKFECWIEPLQPEKLQDEKVLYSIQQSADAGIGRLRSEGLSLDADVRAVRNVSLDQESGRFQSLTFDPHIEFDLHEPLKPGWWRIEAVLAVADEARPRFYSADDGEFFEHHSADLMLNNDGHFVGYVYLACETDYVRFDPSCRPGEIGNIQRLSVRPVSAARVAREALKPSVWAATRKVRGSRALLRRLTNPKAEEGHWPLPVRLPVEKAEALSSGDAYEEWIKAYDYNPQTDDAGYRESIRALAHKPKISVLMPVYKTPINLLDEAISSVRDQLYENWELCIADDASGDALLEARLRYWAKTDPRIKVVFREDNGNISAASNSALELVTGEWVALLDHDDVLRPHALAEVVLAATENPDAQMIYSDEDKIDIHGERYAPYFKPDFSPYLFYGQNFLNHITVHRTEHIRAVGGWRLGLEGSQDYDLNLRILERIGPDAVHHIPKVLYHWRAIEGSTAVSVGEKSHAWEAGRQALEAHFKREGQPLSVGQVDGYPYYQPEWPLPDDEPLVSLVIPTRDGADLVDMCVTSILERSTYSNFEILIVDNQSQLEETHELFRRLKEQDSRIRILSYDEPFNFSAINNFAVAQARGEIIGLINNDIEVISADWLEQMVGLVVRQDVGCVGAMLYYPDDLIQHAGVIMGIGGVAGHSHKYAERGTQGYFARLKLVHEVSAVTAACLLIRKSVYDEVEGLNEEHLRVAFNDVDFCLKVQAAGYRNLFTPRAELYHHESVSRGQEDTNEKRVRFQREVEYMLKRWATDTKPDPHYSPNLTLEHEDFRIRES